MNIATLLADRARQMPEAAALLDTKRGRQRRLSFIELEQAAGRLAALMRGAGLERGDTVLVLCPMSAELYIALIAIFRLGLVAMFLDPSTGRRHVQLSCELRPPQAMIATTQAYWLRMLMPALGRIPRVFTCGRRMPGALSLQQAKAMPCLEPIHPCSPNDPALITFTSGTGGMPKAALRTHGFLLAQYRALQASLELSAGQVDLSTLPIFVLANLASGLTSLIPNVDLRRPKSVDAARVVQQVTDHRVTRAGGSPAFFQQLIAHGTRAGITLPLVDRIYTGGGPVYAELLADLQRLAPAARVTAVYGSTEAEPIACVDHREVCEQPREAHAQHRGLLAGRPVPMIQARIMRNQWGHVVGPFTARTFDAACEPAGVPGEIVVSGPHVLSGYLDPSDNRDTKFDVDRVRWHRTGDAGYLDPQGRIWLLGRCSGCIHDDFGTLYPAPVEEVARGHPHVRQATVIAVRGRRVLAVEPKGRRMPGAQLAALMNALDFARIERAQLIRRMPTDSRHNAKIDYVALRCLLESSPP